MDRKTLSSKTAIFIRSYDRDLSWLKYCLASIEKFGGKYDYAMVVADRKTGSNVLGYCGSIGFPHAVDDESSQIQRGYIAQQYTKLRPDLFLPKDIDYVCNIDSDCMLTLDHDPSVLFEGGRPLMLYTPYADLGDAAAWRAPTEAAVGHPVENEYMRRFPLVYPLEVFEPARRHLEGLHGKWLLHYLQGTPIFSEFNYLGAWCADHAPNSLAWKLTSRDPVSPSPVKQFWSWGGLASAEAEIKSMLGQ